jgi:tryptophan 2,3-dioxygenase
MAELTYASYLHLDELLQLQQARSSPAEHDELLFIVIHQSTELWLKELLHELDKVKTDFSSGLVSAATATLTRVRRIFRVLIQQIDVLETMTPLSFSLFRHRLEHASGFQSMQFRELEFVLGIKRTGALDHYPPDLAGIESARRRLGERTVVDHLYVLLERKGIDVPRDVITRDLTQSTEPNRVVQDGMLLLYLSDGEMRVLFELLTDVDECLQEWRYRHVKMVERTIGNKEGTGGSLGVEFLKKTLFVQAFPDLWAIRHRL